ncbi:MAG: putative transport system permease protein [Acidobacteriota bacterium]|jgi:putative ABC transport system permease protein
MLTHYFTLALKVLWRRKFFTFISLFGISFTLLVLTVVTAMFDNAFGPGTPEPRLNRTLFVDRAVMYGPHSTWTSSAGFKLLDRYARDLPGVERLSIYEDERTVQSFVGGRKIRSALKRTDDEFWRILDFRFVEGGPFGTEDVKQARFVAVINATTRQRFFEGHPAVGRTLEADGQRFRIVGVVEDVSEARGAPFADIWVPYTTAKTDAYKREIIGGWHAMALARDTALMRGIHDEFNSRLLRVELPDPKGYEAIVAPFETKFENFARNMPTGDRKDPESQVVRLIGALVTIGLLFVLIPTVNLVNINISRIMERASEIGVRKAFGAPARTLVGQFLVENILLTLVGALIGFALSVLALRALRQSGIVAYAEFSLNPRVFAWGILLAIGFGFISGVYPAWRMSRLNPVDALKGGVSR